MKFDPMGASLVRYSFGGGTEGQPISAPTSEPPKRPVLVYNGVQYDPERIPWSVWQQMAGEFAVVNGWTFCRMGIRSGASGAGTMQMVFGVVSGCFGIFPAPFIHVDGTGSRHRVCVVLAHLPQAAAVGIFDRLEAARDAGNLAAALAIDWTSEGCWDANTDRAYAAWAAADILVLPEVVIHPEDPSGQKMKIWGRADVIADPGEKRSLS